VLARHPLGLARALPRLPAATGPARRMARGSAPRSSTDPLNRPDNELEGRLADLLATHPPVEERTARLEQMADRLPGATA